MRRRGRSVQSRATASTNRRRTRQSHSKRNNACSRASPRIYFGTRRRWHSSDRPPPTCRERASRHYQHSSENRQHRHPIVMARRGTAGKSNFDALPRARRKARSSSWRIGKARGNRHPPTSCWWMRSRNPDREYTSQNWISFDAARGCTVRLVGVVEVVVAWFGRAVGRRTTRNATHAPSRRRPDSPTIFDLGTGVRAGAKHTVGARDGAKSPTEKLFAVGSVLFHNKSSPLGSVLSIIAPLLLRPE